MALEPGYVFAHKSIHLHAQERAPIAECPFSLHKALADIGLSPQGVNLSRVTIAGTDLVQYGFAQPDLAR